MFLTGAEYKIRQPDDIRRDPDFKDCVIGKEDCVHTCLSMLLRIFLATAVQNFIQKVENVVCDAMYVINSR